MLLPALFLGLLACGHRKDPLPLEIYGRWESSDERYAGRYFELSEDGLVAFGHGETVPHSGHMQSITHAPTRDYEHRYEITYLDKEETEFQLALQFDASLRSFQFDNSSKIRWHRAGEGK